MQPVINVEDLSKRYVLGETLPYRTLRDQLTVAMRAPWRTLAKNRRRAERTDPPAHIWALDGVSFNVAPGEVVGIIGRNGAGKSTLLKILSRITQPTAGRAELHGRIGTLLEVGTGFHGELTGRENIYLNGAILGMRRRDIDRHFDEILAFAEVEKFIDTPVKHYSSGMHVRLAFAVAAHLEPEILVIDEVLAVGDAGFQKKCLSKMKDVAGGGRTILFVSHNMAAIESLCDSCILLKDGRIAARGAPREVVLEYLSSSMETARAEQSLVNHPGRTAGSTPLMTTIRLESEPGVPPGAIRTGSRLSVLIELACPQGLCPVMGLIVKTVQGEPVFNVNNEISGVPFSASITAASVVCEFERMPLMPGQYLIDLYLGARYDNLDVVNEAISFEVLPADVFGSGLLPYPQWGKIHLPAQWRLEQSEPDRSRNRA